MKLKWYEIVYLLFFITIVITLSIIFNTSPFSTISTICGIFAAFFNTKVNKICYFFYLASSILYCYVSFQAKVYGEAILYLFYTIPVYLIAIYNFNKKHEKTEIKSISKKSKLLMTGAIVLITIIYGLILTLIDSVFPFLNAFATALAIFASLFASKMINQQWILWILNSLVLLFIWTYQSFTNFDAIPFVILNIVYLFFNVIGIIKWKKILNKQA